MVPAFDRFMDGLVQPDHLGRYIVGNGAEHRCLKEMEAKQIEKQRLVVILVSPIAQATEIARSEIKREREIAKSETFVTPGRRQNVNRFKTKVPLYEQNSVTCRYLLYIENHTMLFYDPSFSKQSLDPSHRKIRMEPLYVEKKNDSVL